MPELPEVETTRRGIEPYIEGRVIKALRVRERRLRWPVAEQLEAVLPGQTVYVVGRRGKYLCLTLDSGTLILLLGMSGSLRLVEADTPAGTHDHLDLAFEDGHCLRLRDPRRFGALLWTEKDPCQHPRLAGLGPEPLSGDFNGDYLYRRSRGRRVAVKPFLMDSRVVAGMGNIYANEALFMAGIRPGVAAGRLTRPRCRLLAEAVKDVLVAAIEQGGTTLRDFQREDGQPGYFQQELKVYGRNGEPCPSCGGPIRSRVIAQRASYYCSVCQA